MVTRIEYSPLLAATKEKEKVMPSFDVVSEIDMHEFDNALDQATREVGTRYDFKGSESKFEFADKVITLDAGSELQCQQMLEILFLKASKRGISLVSFEAEDAKQSGKRMVQKVSLKQGIDKDMAKKIVKEIKNSKLKVQAQIQGEQVRVTGKKRDHLQEVMQFLNDADLKIPLQFENFRD
jgi:hypothetical protein